MIFNSYTEQNEQIMGYQIKSCGHIFAQKGRIINRPNGRNDWLLFYIAKGSEKFFLDEEIIAKEGSFIIYKPGEKQKHICVSDITSEFYYIHFITDENNFDFAFKTSKLYKQCFNNKNAES